MGQAFYTTGAYVGEVTVQAFTKAKTGTTQFYLKFKVLGEPDHDDKGGYLPVKQQFERSIYMALTEKTAPWVKETISGMGFTGTMISELDPSHPQHFSFIGQQFDFYCKVEPDQSGGTRENWSVSRGQKPVEPLESAQKRQLDALFGRFGGVAKKAVGAAVASGRPAHDDTEITDDDIPF